MEKITSKFRSNPLISILILAFTVRLIAVTFSQGYLMHDDHFLVIEAAQSWVDGYDYNNWLPKNSKSGNPTGHSMFYVGIHYIFLSVLNILNISDPAVKMFFVRLLHAIYSLLVVFLGYKITKKIDGEKSAIGVGLLLAIFWFFPILSVHNLVEFVCIPPILAGLWYSIKYKETDELNNIFYAGLFFGIAIGLRIQTCFFPIGIGLLLFIEKKWKAGLLLGLSVVFSFFLTQIADLFTWGRPFAEITEYISYNLENTVTYGVSPWYKYILLILGILIPPISIVFLLGFLRYSLKFRYILIPSLLFLVFHSLFPNKQERFILPLIPIIIMMGYIFIRDLKNSSLYLSNPKFIKSLKTTFLLINTLLLLLVSTSYTKKSRAEALRFLSKQSDLESFFVDLSHNDIRIWQPLFYFGKWKGPYYIFSDSEKEWIREKVFDKKNPGNYVLLYGEEDLENRLKKFDNIVSDIKYVTKIEPCFMDKTLHYLNPNNRNETVFIYKLYTSN